MNIESHNEFQDQIAAYVAGGLDASERAAFESHLSNCPECAARLHEAQRADREMTELFGDARPIPGFEDRVVQRLRMGGKNRWSWPILHPMVRRVASGVAAVLVLGAIGYAANDLIVNNRLPWAAPMRHTRLASASRLGRPADEQAYVADLEASAAGALKHRVEPDGVRDLKWSAGKLEIKGVQKHLEANAPRQEALTVAEGQQVHGKEVGGRDNATKAPSLDVMTYPGNWPNISDASKAGAGNIDNSLGANVPQGGQAAGLASSSIAGGAGYGGGRAGGLQVRTGVQKGESMALGDTPAFGAYFKPAEIAAGQKEKFAAGKEVAEGISKLDFAGGDVHSGKQKDIAGDGDLDLGKPLQPQQPAQETQKVQPNPTPQTQQEVQFSRKIIRNGEMEFEVENFDAAFVQISKIVTEDGGFIASTDSEKLPNGKVRGTITVRVPPGRLDTLVLKLRALGDLKTQKIAAQDVTKMYTDLESELKAARAMEERLLNIIKTGKGEIKDLVEAEKQLGVYREKIEKVEGEVRYYNNLISLSTLKITMTEKDIKSAAFASQTEFVQMGVETEDVEKARTDATKAIDDAKGRIIESNLKRYDAGQFAATIVAEVSPDAAGPLIDRLKQLGRIVRLDIDRKQTTPPGSTSPLTTSRIEKKDTRFSISIYNLANIAPRQTTSMQLAVTNVEEAYKAILETVKGKAGRIVTSSLNRQKPEQTVGAIYFEVPTAEADATLTEIRREREVTSLSVTENPDTNNVTAAKRGFQVTISSLANILPREAETQMIATKVKVADAYRAILEELRKSEAHVTGTQLNEQDPQNVTATLQFDVLRTKLPAIEKVMKDVGVVYARSVQRLPENQTAVDSKLGFMLTLISAERVAPRETVTMRLEVSNIDRAVSDATKAADAAGGHSTVESTQSRPENSQLSSQLVIDVPLNQAQSVRQQLKDLGSVQLLESTRNSQAPEGQIGRARFELSLVSPDVSQSMGGAIRNGWSVAFRGLMWSVTLIVIGLLFVAPWAVVLWAVWRLSRRSRATPTPAT